jgi:hypothetical protein
MKTKYNLYRYISKYFKYTFLFTGLLYIITTTNGCKKDDNTVANKKDSITYSLSDLLGTWQRHSLVTDSANEGFWIYANIVNTDGSSTAHYILPNGHNMDTTYTGTGVDIFMTLDGVITTVSDPAAHSYLSSDKNLWVGTTKRNNLFTLVIDQKFIPGTNYTAADFQGTWQTHCLIGGGSWTGWIHSASTIDNSGHYIIDNLVKSDGNTNVSTGTFSISSTGVITVGEVSTYNGFMSADKKLMATNMTDGGGGGGLAIAQKVVAGTTYSNADLQGKWQMHDILVGSNNWTEHGIMTIDAIGNGIVSDMIKDNGGSYDNPGTLILSVSSDGIVTYGTDFHGFISADKKVLIGTRSHDTGHAFSLMVLQKMP